ncbi:nucleotidyltransferase substrate binding protein [Undibacterium sp. Ren11W]|uniref:nucleotidyltransferase substrate binding protein n=1 Tax=Undibacterium sp. Ren11W TaxID=3413045 RepID=UPI003BF1BA2C
MIYLNTDHLQRCIQTLQSSLRLYQAAEAGSIDQEVFRNAIVKGYELSQEAAFKLLRKALKEYGHSSKKLNETPIKDVLRLAASHSLMSVAEVEHWFSYRDNRNNTAHGYGEGFAKQTLILLPGFITDISRLAQQLEAKLGKDSDHAQA